jgi:hypothetical protein
MDKEFRRPLPNSSTVVWNFIMPLLLYFSLLWLIKSRDAFIDRTYFFLFVIVIFYPLDLIIRKIWPLLAIKGDILYVARLGYWKPREFHFADIDHIKIIRQQNAGIGRKDYFNYLIVETKSSKSYKTNLHLRTEKDCEALDEFMRNTLPNIRIVEEFHHWKENWS